MQRMWSAGLDPGPTVNKEMSGHGAIMGLWRH